MQVNADICRTDDGQMSDRYGHIAIYPDLAELQSLFVSDRESDTAVGRDPGQQAATSPTAPFGSLPVPGHIQAGTLHGGVSVTGPCTNVMVTGANKATLLLYMERHDFYCFCLLIS
jgi:hypothetical protein